MKKLPIQERKHKSFLKLLKKDNNSIKSLEQLWCNWHHHFTDKLHWDMCPSLYSVDCSPLKSRLAAKRDPELQKKINQEQAAYERELESIMELWVEHEDVRKYVQTIQNQEYAFSNPVSKQMDK